jgi:hypothetical protein
MQAGTFANKNFRDVNLANLSSFSSGGVQIFIATIELHTKPSTICTFRRYQYRMDMLLLGSKCKFAGSSPRLEICIVRRAIVLPARIGFAHASTNKKNEPCNISSG